MFLKQNVSIFRMISIPRPQWNQRRQHVLQVAQQQQQQQYQQPLQQVRQLPQQTGAMTFATFARRPQRPSPPNTFLSSAHRTAAGLHESPMYNGSIPTPKPFTTDGTAFHQAQAAPERIECSSVSICFSS